MRGSIATHAIARLTSTDKWLIKGIRIDNLILGLDSISNLLPLDNIGNSTEEDEDNNTTIQVTRIAVQVVYIEYWAQET